MQLPSQCPPPTLFVSRPSHSCIHAHARAGQNTCRRSALRFDLRSPFVWSWSLCVFSAPSARPDHLSGILRRISLHHRSRHPNQRHVQRCGKHLRLWTHLAGKPCQWFVARIVRSNTRDARSNWPFLKYRRLNGETRTRCARRHQY